MDKFKRLILVFSASILRLPFVRGKITIFELLFRFLRPKDTVVRLNVCGRYVALDLAQQQVRYIFCGAYEKAERKFLSNFLREGDVAIDVGANYGYLSAEMLCKVGASGKIYAFEPNPMIFNHLDLLAAQTDGRMTACKLAVGGPTTGGENGQIKFYINSEHSMLSSTIEDHAWTDDPVVISVDTTTLADFIAEERIGRVDLIKIDVEGGEVDVLEGLQPHFANDSRPALLCEVTPTADERWTRMVTQVGNLQELGYQIYEIAGDASLHRLSLASFRDLPRQANLVFSPVDRLVERNIVKSSEDAVHK